MVPHILFFVNDIGQKHNILKLKLILNLICILIEKNTIL